MSGFVVITCHTVGGSSRRGRGVTTSRYSPSSTLDGTHPRYGLGSDGYGPEIAISEADSTVVCGRLLRLPEESS